MAFATGRPLESLTNPCNVAVPGRSGGGVIDCSASIIVIALSKMLTVRTLAPRRKWLAVGWKRRIGQAQVAESIGVKLARQFGILVGWKVNPQSNGLRFDSENFPCLFSNGLEDSKISALA